MKNQNIYKIIINSLIQLQNRGYDSSRICVIKNNYFEINKYSSTNSLSSIDKLLSLNLKSTIHTDNNIENINIGIGHNRWATHGGKTDNNARPHISNDKQ